MDKAEVRRHISAMKRALTQQQIKDASGRLGLLLASCPLYQQANTLYGYLPFNQEVQTIPILNRALAEGKRVAVPKVYGDEMRFIYITDLTQIKPGFKGIPEPVMDEPVADDPMALVLIPGLAFDTQGHRVGYGGGFYDRFLKREALHPTVALCYDFQIFPLLNTEIHDVPVDMVLSTHI